MNLFKKVVMATAFFTLTLPALSQANSNKNPWTQCGIGALIFDHTPWAAAISNIIWDLGTTASTSTSTSDQTCNGKVATSAKFIYETYANVEEETSMGSGKHLSTMLNLLGCDKSSHSQIIGAVREDFKTTLASADYANGDKLSKAKSYHGLVLKKVSESFASKCQI